MTPRSRSPDDPPESEPAPHPDHLVVGQINKPHGTKGDFYVWPLTDHVEETFRPGHTFRVADLEGDRPDPLFPEVEIEHARPYRKGLLVAFRGIEGRTVAEPFRGRYLLRAFEEAPPADPDEFFYHELLAMVVVTADGEEVGPVVEVYELDPHDLIEVRTEEGEVLIPLARDFVVSVDREAGRITVDPPEGLLDLS